MYVRMSTLLNPIMVDANCDEQDRRWWNKLATVRGQFITLTVHLVQPALERRRNFKWLCEHLSNEHMSVKNRVLVFVRVKFSQFRSRLPQCFVLSIVDWSITRHRVNRLCLLSTTCMLDNIQDLVQISRPRLRQAIGSINRCLIVRWLSGMAQW